jgi:hypothetical protein
MPTSVVIPDSLIFLIRTVRLLVTAVRPGPVSPSVQGIAASSVVQLTAIDRDHQMHHRRTPKQHQNRIFAQPARRYPATLTSHATAYLPRR